MEQLEPFGPRYRRERPAIHAIARGLMVASASGILVLEALHGSVLGAILGTALVACMIGGLVLDVRSAYLAGQLDVLEADLP